MSEGQHLAHGVSSKGVQDGAADPRARFAGPAPLRPVAVLVAAALLASCTAGAPQQNQDASGPRWLSPDPTPTSTSDEGQASPPGRSTGDPMPEGDAPTASGSPGTPAAGGPADPPNFLDTGWQGSRSFESTAFTSADAVLAMRQTGFLDARNGDAFVRTYRPDGTWASDVATLDQTVLERDDPNTWRAAPAPQEAVDPADHAPAPQAVATRQPPVYSVDYDHALTTRLNVDDLPSVGVEAGAAPPGTELQYAPGSVLGWTRWWRDGRLVAEETAGWLQTGPAQSPPVGVVQATAYAEPEQGEDQPIAALSQGVAGVDLAGAADQAAALGIGDDTEAASTVAPATLEIPSEQRLPSRPTPVTPIRPSIEQAVWPADQGVQTVAVAAPGLGPASVNVLPAASLGMLAAVAVGSLALPGGGALRAIAAPRALIFFFLAAAIAPFVIKALSDTLAAVLEGLGERGGTRPGTRPGTTQPPPAVKNPPGTERIPGQRAPGGGAAPALAQLVKQYEAASGAKGLTTVMATAAARACLASRIAQYFPEAKSPCGGDVRVIFYGGVDLPDHYDNISKAIVQRPDWAKLNRRFPIPDGSRRWLRSVPECRRANQQGLNCDEYPFNSTQQAGPGARVAGVDPDESNAQGGVMSGFYASKECQPFTDGTSFFVIPVKPSITFHICR